MYIPYVVKSVPQTQKRSGATKVGGVNNKISKDISEIAAKSVKNLLRHIIG